jgi:acetyl esterase
LSNDARRKSWKRAFTTREHFDGTGHIDRTIGRQRKIPLRRFHLENPDIMNTHRLRFVLATLLTGFLLLGTAHAQKADRKSAKPKPDIANEHYGPHERNVLDFWKAKSETPTPLVVYIHGGGFRAGSKESVSGGLIAGLTGKGISVTAINYRLSPEVTFPSHYMDSARAIQYARHHAKEWNIDPKRIGATGGSAGAGTSLWIGFHDDMADPKNADPVLRESTRLSCMAVFGAQSTYDPFVITEWIGEAAARHPALEGFYGLTWDQFQTPAAREMFTKAAAITYLTRDDPPVYAFYNEARGPLPADAKPGQGIHHINFGLKLKEQMDKLGIECTVRHADEKTDSAQEMIDFFVKHLAAGK